VVADWRLAMPMRITTYLFLLALFLLPGCVVLPLPHTRTAIPEITGRLVPPPPSGTVVQYRLVPHIGRSRYGTTTATADGSFQIPEERRWAFLFIVNVLPLDAVWDAELELSASPYGKCSQRLFRFPAQLNRVHLGTFELGEIRLE